MNNTSLGHFYAKFPRGKFTILARAKYNQLGREEIVAKCQGVQFDILNAIVIVLLNSSLK